MISDTLLFVMIRLTFYNSTCTIERLCKDEAYHLMREGHLGKGNLLVGAVIYCLRETVGTSDDKHESSGSSLLALYPFGKLDASKLLSMFVHQHYCVRRLQQFLYQFAFALFLLLFAQTLGVLEFGTMLRMKGKNIYIMLKMFSISV